MSLECPSFDSGYAWNAAVAEGFAQWDGIAALCVPYLGMQGNTLYDLSGYLHPMTLVNVAATDWAPTERMGEALWGLTFNGTSSYGDFTDATLFNFPNATFTVSLWVKTSSVAGNTYLLNKRGGSPSSGWMVRMNADGTITARIMDTDTSGVAAERISVGTVNNGVYHLVAVDFTTDTVTAANNSLNIYIDGLLSQGSLTQSGFPYQENSTDAVKVGVQSNLPGGTFFTGAVDDIRIYSRVLTDLEVWQLYTDSFAMLRLAQQAWGSALAVAGPMAGSMMLMGVGR